MSTQTRWLCLIGIYPCLVLNSVGAPAQDEKAPSPSQNKPRGEERPDSNNEATPFRRPILVAMAWEHADKSKRDKVQAAWRPDGTRIDDDETGWLHKELKSFDVHPSRLPFLHRPLVLVFQVDERAVSPQMLRVTGIADKTRFEQCAGAASRETFLARAAIAPMKSQFKEWPAEIDVEVQVPVGEPDLIKRIEQIPADPIQLDQGVRWYVDRTGSLSDDLPTAEKGGKAVVLERNRTEADPLLEVSCRVLLKGEHPNFTRFAPRKGNLDLQIVQIVHNESDIEAVEFYRRRYRIERYEKLPIRAELMPE